VGLFYTAPEPTRGLDIRGPTSKEGEEEGTTILAPFSLHFEPACCHSVHTTYRAENNLTNYMSNGRDETAVIIASRYMLTRYQINHITSTSQLAVTD